MTWTAAGQIAHEKTVTAVRYQTTTGFRVTVYIPDNAHTMQWSWQWSGATPHIAVVPGSELNLMGTFKSHTGWGSYIHAQSLQTGSTTICHPFRGGGGANGWGARINANVWHFHYNGFQTTSPADVHLSPLGGDFYEFAGRFSVARVGNANPWGFAFESISGETAQVSVHATADTWDPK